MAHQALEVGLHGVGRLRRSPCTTSPRQGGQRRQRGAMVGGGRHAPKKAWPLATEPLLSLSSTLLSSQSPATVFQAWVKKKKQSENKRKNSGNGRGTWQSPGVVRREPHAFPHLSQTGSTNCRHNARGAHRGRMVRAVLWRHDCAPGTYDAAYHRPAAICATTKTAVSTAERTRSAARSVRTIEAA